MRTILSIGLISLAAVPCSPARADTAHWSDPDPEIAECHKLTDIYAQLDCMKVAFSHGKVWTMQEIQAETAKHAEEVGATDNRSVGEISADQDYQRAKQRWDSVSKRGCYLSAYC